MMRMKTGDTSERKPEVEGRGDPFSWEVEQPIDEMGEDQYTEAKGVTPSIKPGTGVIRWKIKGQGDAAAFAVDATGIVPPPEDWVDCLVPPPPK